MAVKKFNRTLASRHATILDNKSLTVNAPIKSLTKIKKSTAGRNSLGRIVCFHRGGGVSNRNRLIDWGIKKGGNGSYRTLRLEYDPTRTGQISLIADKKGNLSYQLASNSASSGNYLDFWSSPQEAVAKVPKRYISERNVTRLRSDTVLTLPMKFIPSGSSIFNIEVEVGKGPIFCRSAGAVGRRYRSNKPGFVQVQLPSGEQRLVSGDCIASFGQVSAPDHKQIVIGTAGRRRRKGIRPTVRGSAMNPVDHPHGGGEGRRNGGRPSVSPWGKIVHWKQTRKSKDSSNIVRSRKIKL